jgi:hypothetical protein
MKDDETITFNKKEIKLMMGYLNNYVEFVMLASLEDGGDWDFKEYFDKEEKFNLLNKIRKMCEE